MQEQAVPGIDDIDAGAFVDSKGAKTAGVSGATVDLNNDGAMTTSALREGTGCGTLVALGGWSGESS